MRISDWSSDVCSSDLYEARWQQGGLAFLGGFTDLLIDPVANETAAEFIRERIRATVTDPEVAERLIPDQVVGCKRLCVDTGYYDNYNRPNVTPVALRQSPIVRSEEHTSVIQ